MTDILKDFYFNIFCKGRKNLVSTPRYAKKLRAMRHSPYLRLLTMPHSAAELWLLAMPHSAEFPLHTTPPSLKFKSKIFLLTPRYVATWGVDSTLCRIEGSHDSALCHNSALCRIAQICYFALCGIARSRFLASNGIELLCEFKSTCKTVLVHESGDPGVQFDDL
jgi:hypothetical protein